MMPRQSLAIYLIKSSYSQGEKCIREKDLPTLEKYNIKIAGASFACLYARRNRPRYPDWNSLFPEIDWSKYRTRSYSGLLLVDVADRRFAITAGGGRFLLDPFAIEENFGFKTVINSVDPKTIRKIEKKTINQNPMNSIEQLTRISGLQDFQVDYYTDIISKIRAKSTVSVLGSIIDGRDSLQISIECDAAEIPGALRTCLASYQSDVYQKHFPNIDNISPVGDRELAEALDNELINRLNNGQYDCCWASMPEIIQDENFDVFQFTARENALRYHDIELAACLEKYTNRNKTFTKSDLERDEIYIRALDGNVYPRWHVWKCIYAEIDRDDRFYVLIDGKWYRISQSFIQTLADQIANIPIARYGLPHWKQHDKERDYLAGIGGEFQLLDRNLVQVEGHTPIELCDLYLPERTFIHVKRYGSSEVLSHLFNQGKVAAKLLLEDRRFREQAHAKFSAKVPFEIEERPDPRTFTIVFLIGSKFGENQPLPLFARVVLVDVFTELRNYGFNVELGFIKVDLV